MVLDNIANCELHCAHHSLFAKAFEFLKTVSENDFENSRVELDGENCFALFFKGEGKGADKIVLEAHRKYIDIQYVFKGSDLMGYRYLNDCVELNTAYNEKDDYILFSDQLSTKFTVTEKSFVIFYPTDAHAPLLGVDNLLKVVVKVRV
jgi:biofilm protein TabA